MAKVEFFKEASKELREFELYYKKRGQEAFLALSYIDIDLYINTLNEVMKNCAFRGLSFRWGIDTEPITTFTVDACCEHLIVKLQTKEVSVPWLSQQHLRFLCYLWWTSEKEWKRDWSK